MSRKSKRRGMSRIAVGTAVGICTLGVLAAQCYGAGMNVEASNFSPTSAGDASVSTAGGTATLSFGPINTGDSRGNLRYASVVADPSSVFGGNLAAAGVQGITFRIKGDGHTPSEARLEVKGDGGRTWITENVQVSEVTGKWVINNVPLTARAEGGWDRAVPTDPAAKDEAWGRVLASVQTIRLAIDQGGVESQSYTIDNFMLVGANGMLTPLQLSLLHHQFGVTTLDLLSGGQAGKDSDRDGVSDVDSILAGEDPGLAVEVKEVTVDGPKLRWPCVVDDTARYTVYRTESLTQHFAELNDGKGKDLQAAPEETAKGEMTFVDDTADAGEKCFYKVVKTVVGE